MDEFYQEFIEESKDILERVSEDLDCVEQAGLNSDLIDSIFRGVHTVKGGAGMFSMNNTMHVAHRLESFLGQCKKDYGKFDLGYVRTELDIICELLENGDQGDAEDIEGNAATKPEVENKVVSPEIDLPHFPDFWDSFGEIFAEQVSEGAKIVELSGATAKEPLKQIKPLLINEGLEVLRENPGEGEARWYLVALVVKALQESEKIQELLERYSLGDSPVTSIEEECRETSSIDKPEQLKVTPLGSKSGEGKANNFLRVPLDRINTVLSGIWEIFLIRNQMAYLFQSNRSALKMHLDFLQDWEVLDNSLRRNISEIESAVMGMRMTSLKGPFARMKQVVRSYIRGSEKKIEIHTSGDDIELDKKVIDLIGEPLIHLVRNSMDHGIESPIERANKGKPEVGRIDLCAQTTSDKVILTVSDDGNGIDIARLREKAAENGIEVKGSTNVDDDLQLIFHPGLSTAEKVSDISGRGVGMDAVKQSINKLGGEIRVETEADKGSTFTIELPLSMSLISAIIYEVNQSWYASSINSVLEVCRVDNSDLIINDSQEFFLFRDEYIPVVDMRKIVGTSDDDRRNEESEIVSLCVVESGESQIALRVNQVSRHMELVVKELKGHFPEMPLVNGVSILPTGVPIFIISLEQMFKSYQHQAVGRASYV